MKEVESYDILHIVTWQKTSFISKKGISYYGHVQNCGVGSALMNAVFDKAKSLQIKVIYAEVSITAKPFFKSKGFKVIKKQIVKLRGVELTNYLMEIQNRKF